MVFKRRAVVVTIWSRVLKLLKWVLYACLTIFLATSLSFCHLLSQDQVKSLPPLDFEYLARDAHYAIGDLSVTVPNIAGGQGIGWASTSGKTGTLRLRLFTFGLFGESAASLEICARLTRVWAQRVCRNERPGTTKNIPYDGFDIVPRSSIFVLKNIGFAWGGTAYEQLTKILKIDHSLHEANITCDAKQYCHGAISVSPEVVAFWFVSSGKAHDEALKLARRQGRAIVAMVTEGLGPIEKTDWLQD